MISSMTGYGKAIIELPGKNLTVEIKSLNSKQLDISLKLPGAFREKEPEIRNYIAQKMERGKIDFYLSTEITGDVLNYSINKTLAKKYYQEIKELSEEINEKERPACGIVFHVICIKIAAKVGNLIHNSVPITIGSINTGKILF